ncbi:hypothetical protein ACFL2A_05685 [Thermodesulfobacteriota bacterium]
MKKLRSFLILFFLFSVLLTHDAFACFGDKIGIAHLNGMNSEFSAHLIAIYVKEKTGIDSVVNEFESEEQIESSFQKDESDIVILTYDAKPDIMKLSSDKKDSKFFTLVSGNDINIVLRVSKKRLEEMKFFTLNKVMKRVPKIISKSDFMKWLGKAEIEKMYLKEAARKYLLEEDKI